MSEPTPSETEKLRREIEESSACLRQFLDANPPRPSSKDSSGRVEPFWNAISVVSPLFGVVIGIIVGYSGPPGGWGFGTMGRFLMAVFACTGIGLFAALVAAARGEDRRSLTNLGLGINGLLVFLFLLIFLQR
jgi:hypothetical protein